MPLPPSSSGKAQEKNPNAPILATRSARNSCFASSCSRVGAMSSAANRWAVSWISRCSSESSKFMVASILCKRASFEHNEQGLILDSVPDLDLDFLHRASAGRIHVVFHLQRLDDHEFIVFLDLGTGFDQHGQDFSRQRSQNICHSYPLSIGLRCVAKILSRVAAQCCRAGDQGGVRRASGQHKLAQTAGLEFDRDQRPAAIIVSSYQFTGKGAVPGTFCSVQAPDGQLANGYGAALWNREAGPMCASERKTTWSSAQAHGLAVLTRFHFDPLAKSSKGRTVRLAFRVDEVIGTIAQVSMLYDVDEQARFKFFFH